MGRARKVFGRDGNFIRARDADDLDARNLGAPQFRLGRPQHRVHVARVVARCDDGEAAAGRPDFMRLNLAKHRGELNHERARMNTEKLESSTHPERGCLSRSTFDNSKTRGI